MKKKNRSVDPHAIIARHLHSLKRLNEESGGSEELTEALSHLCEHLIATPFASRSQLVKHSRPKVQSAPEIEALDLNALDQIIASENTPRRVLETVASKRFGVPAGSMRSFSTIKILREKLLTLVENERAHEAINAAAKRSAD